MEEIHNYRIKAWWTSGRTGIANCDSAPNAIHFTAPVQFGGVEGRWTPEDLLLTAIGSCFATTFRALADYSQLKYSDLEVEVAGTVQKASSGYIFNEIVTRPHLTISRKNDEERARRLLHKTQELCLVTRMLSARHTFEPKVHLGGAAKPLTTGADTTGSEL
jgi:peroxiredoxin-like protein